MNPLNDKISTQQFQFHQTIPSQTPRIEIQVAHKAEHLAKEILFTVNTTNHQTNKLNLDVSLISQHVPTTNNSLNNKNYFEHPIAEQNLDTENKLNTDEFDELNEFDKFDDFDTDIEDNDIANLEQANSETFFQAEQISTETDKTEQSQNQVFTKNVSTVDTKLNMEITGKGIAAARIQNLYRYEGDFKSNTVAFTKLMDAKDLHQATHTFNAGNYILPDFETGKAFVPKSSGIPVGMHIELEGKKFTIHHLTEEEEESLTTEWHEHVNAQAPQTEEIKEEVHDKTESLDQKSTAYDTIPLNAKLSVETKSSSWVENHIFEAVSLRMLQGAITEKKNKEKSALKEEIQKEDLAKEILKDSILNDRIARTGIKDNILKTDTLKGGIIRQERQFHNTMVAGHRLAIIPTIAG